MLNLRRKQVSVIIINCEWNKKARLSLEITAGAKSRIKLRRKFLASFVFTSRNLPDKQVHKNTRGHTKKATNILSEPLFANTDSFSCCVMKLRNYFSCSLVPYTCSSTPFLESSTGINKKRIPSTDSLTLFILLVEKN